MVDEYYFNAGFDAGLGAGGIIPARLKPVICELSLHFLLAVPEGGSMVIHADVPDDFLSRLREAGLLVPEIRQFPEISRGRRFVPFGWDGEALAMSRSYELDVSGEYPSLEAVRKVNSKAFARALAEEILGDPLPGGVFHEERALEEYLQNHRDGEWLLKTCFGSAGMGRCKVSPGSEVPGKWISRSLAGGLPVIAEPWMDRCMDMSTRFHISPGGQVSGICTHEVLNTPGGTFAGVLMDERSERLKPWQSQIEDTARKVGAALFSQGYFGPVCLDAYTWRGPDRKLRLRQLHDINARLTMSLPAYRIYCRGDKKMPVLWKFYKCSADRAASAAARTTQAAGEGRRVILTSPASMVYEGASRPLDKVSILFTAPSVRQLWETERDFSHCLEMA